ncbi:MAG: hypothetical protein VB084_06930 [Syntrophomonadaceae bacterium]|nr:hypothetical protein [Syntrophomonadaceae bacterium]
MGIFGNGPKEVNSEREHFDSDYQLKIESLQREIVQARAKLKESQTRMAELQNKLEEYLGKERQIAEVMINAQINAQKIEAQARVKAEVLLQETDEELRRKKQELELLQITAQKFKQELSDRIDQYKSSLESIMASGDDTSFTPTLVSKEKNEQKLIG